MYRTVDYSSVRRPALRAVQHPPNRAGRPSGNARGDVSDGRVGFNWGAVMRKIPLQIHPSSLGGFTLEGPYFRRRSRLARAVDRFFHWLGA